MFGTAYFCYTVLCSIAIVIINIHIKDQLLGKDNAEITDHIVVGDNFIFA